ncbi:hypothetical protein [Streptomyces vietnamensis]|uniref:hypothetical protein n=1 Tax=Streptomyces vietnamensis TaxID=362257 RepID=UPI0006969BA2|nr:hypothetical protein [Streptomyces vietnamensis]
MSDGSDDAEFGQGSFDLSIDLLLGIDLARLRRDRLCDLLEKGLAMRQAIRQRPDPQQKVARAIGLNKLQGLDEHDLREALRVLDSWFREPSEEPPPARRSRFDRPTGVGQLPVPRCVKKALATQACGLCADPIKPGDEIGRMRPLKKPRNGGFPMMGWLCRHCLFDRRETPRRRDLLIRFFHHLLNTSAVGLNARECDLLHTWLTSGTARSSQAWRDDPLDATLVRLATSVTEDKPNTWVAFPTSVTILKALQTAETEGPDTCLLADVLQHVQEWDTNPQGVDHARYGTGVAYRQQVLARTTRPTFLSDLGGPFFLHKAPDPADEDTETASAEPS